MTILGDHENLEHLSDRTTTATNDGSTTSSDTNRSQPNLSTKHGRTKKRHQQRPSTEKAMSQASSQPTPVKRPKSPIPFQETRRPASPKILTLTERKAPSTSSADTEIEDYALDFSSPKDAGSPTPPSSRKPSVSQQSPVKALVNATRPVVPPKPTVAQPAAAKPVLRRNSPPLPRLPPRTNQSKSKVPDDDDGDSFFD